ncbi:hypothetical protein ABZX85_47305 [Streptomyces sp. NPDC004539]|uniref:hypothetical protein n=1 Tax=Streptomyces sp. NPDC004539 TaxID=3154280 RepID=UPI0033B17D17
MTRWFRSYWAEDDTWFYVEADAGGGVTRQVELRGPLQKPVAAAASVEEEAARRAGTLVGYEATFGATAGVPVGDWDGYAPQDLTAEEFEAVWVTARAACVTSARVRSARGT